jgi:integrase
MASPSRHPGITIRHSRRCGVHDDRPCSCTPSYRAEVWSARDGRKIRKDCRTLAEAKAWRADAMREIRLGTRRASAPLTVAAAAEAWLTGARAGSIRNRSGDEYKPSSIRSYEEALRIRVLPELGSRRLDTITRSDLQGLVDRLLAEGQHPSTIRNSLMPLRAIFRRTIARGDLAINPTRGLELPAVRGTRDRIAAPKEAAALLAALEQDRAVWTTAMYAGLRRGELRALELSDIDLDANLIRVQRSWDAVEGLIEPKLHAGRRTVPVPGVLRSALVEHLGSLSRSSGLAFGQSARVPFQPKSLSNRAGGAWKRAGLQPITLHECRHTFASLMIAAGVNAKALSTYMGHASVMITLDRYGHLMPGNEREAAGLLDAFLSRSRGE